MLALAYYLGRGIAKEEFERTNAQGIQEYKSFGEMEKRGFKTVLIRLVQFPLALIGVLVIILALAKCGG